MRYVGLYLGFWILGVVLFREGDLVECVCVLQSVLVRRSLTSLVFENLSDVYLVPKRLPVEIISKEKKPTYICASWNGLSAEQTFRFVDSGSKNNFFLWQR